MSCLGAFSPAAVLGLEMRLRWSEMTLAMDGRADVPLRHLTARQENKVLAGGRAAQAGEQSDVLAGGTYWSWGRGVNNRRTIGGRSGREQRQSAAPYSSVAPV
jgi:hypothetical protein